MGLGREIWDEVPVILHESGRFIDIDFVPRLPGPYLLRVEDETGLGLNRYFDVRIQTDPSPAVDLQRPSPARESLSLLPDAEFSLAALTQDKIFALKQVFVEYRTARTDEYRRIAAYDSESVRSLIPALAPFVHLPLSLPPPPFPRLQAYALGRRMSVRQFTHPDGSPLKEGDILALASAQMTTTT